MFKFKLACSVYFNGPKFGYLWHSRRCISSCFASITATRGVEPSSNIICTNAPCCMSTNDIQTSCIEGYRTRTIQRDFQAVCGGFGEFNTSKLFPISKLTRTHNKINLRPFTSKALLPDTKDESIKERYEEQDNNHVHKDISNSKRMFGPYEYEFDVNGYLAVDDVVKFLQQEAAYDICVIKTSGARRAYVDYFIVASGVSIRHIRAMSKNLEQLFRGHNIRGISKHGHVTVEGLESDSNWLAVDIGNMVVHFFLPEVRQIYELEKLWTLGSKYDDQYKALLEEEDFLQAVFLGEKTQNPDLEK